MAITIHNRFNLTEGMVSNIGTLLLKEGEGELLKNIDLDIIGKLSKRKGNCLFGSQIVASQSILGMYEFITSAGTSYQLAVCYDNSANNDIYKIVSTTLNGAITTSSTTIILTDASDFTSSGTIEIEGDLCTYTGKTSNNLTGCTGISFSHADAKTVRQFKISLADDTANKKTRFTSFLDYVFRVNGAEAMSSSADCTTWGTTNCLATLTPSLIACFQDRLFAAGDASFPDRLYASSLPSLAGAITWDTSTQIIDKTGSSGYYFDINPEDGSNISAIERNGAQLLIFKDKSMYTWNGSSTQADTLIEVGAISQEVVKTVQNITFFLGRSKKDLGIFAFTGAHPKNIGRKVKKWIDAIDQTTLSTLCAGVTTDKYMLYIGSITFSGDDIYEDRTFSNVWLVYSISKDAWSIYTGLAARMFGHYTISSAEKLFYGDTNGKIFEIDQGTTDDSGDSETEIEMEFIGKEETLGTVAYPKSLEQLVAYSTQAQESAIKYRYNRGRWLNIGTLRSRVTVLDTPEKDSTERQGETIQLKLTNSSKYTSNLEGYAIGIGDISREVRGENKYARG